MNRHIVMWRLHRDTPEAMSLARAQLKQAFEGLRGRITGLRHLEVGLDSNETYQFTDFSDETTADRYRGTDYSTVTDFAKFLGLSTSVPFAQAV